MIPALQVDIGSYSSKGIKQDNEDFYGAYIPKEPQLTYKGITVAIADGMSGSEAGKQASHCCIVGFIQDYYSTPDSWTVLNSAQKILSATNSWLYSQGQVRYFTSKGMVSTLSALILKSNTAYVFHIGDSRIYRLRNNNLEQLTRDHRIWISEDKNYLNRAMGIEPFLEVDHKHVSMLKGDLFVLCTDGIHDFIDDKELKTLLSAGGDLDTLARSIVDRAEANGSDDNLTCQLVRIERLPDLREDEVLRRHENLPFPPLLESGMSLDGYRIEAELHASKRTQVYRAYDTQNDRRVILKTPSPLFNDDTHYIEHFLHEEWAGKRIQNPHVLKILDTDRDKSCLYYVTEYIDGLTLREWITLNPKPDIKPVRQMVEQIAKGLLALHRMEMLHQDLKPENIMIDRAGIVKIIDFGSVKIAGIAEIAPLEPGVQENVLGTLNYTAPEYHFGQRSSVKSDLFSLGVIAYEMLNGALPFGCNMPEKPDRIKLGRLEYVPSIYHNEMVPVWIDGALKKATALNAQFRYDELSEFLRDLASPNPEFLKPEDRIPLMQRNPLLFWKSLSGLLLLANLIMLYLLSR
ncbi:MAG: protein kinase domain-containing protein [Gammaproteobacteria bacterium]